MALSELHLSWLTKRGLDPEVASRLGVASGSRADGGKVDQDGRGNVLIFPYSEHGIVVSEKYRAPNKIFWQREGGKRTFFNADVLDDPVLTEGREPLVITEGELDCVAVLSAGRPFAVSVPDGAVPVPEGTRPDDVSEDDCKAEATGKLAFLWNNRERLQKIRRYVIATDGDDPGRRMAAILVKHLGAARCSRMEFPDGCKDPNDILKKFGPKALSDAVANAKPYPVRGIYELTDFPHEETKLFDPVIEGWSGKLKIFEGAFIVVTGPTSHGKSTFAMEVAANMAMHHKWRIAIFSPEQRPFELCSHLRTLYLAGQEWTRENVTEADNWIRRHFKLILGDPVATGDRDDDITLQWLLDRGEDAVLRYNIDMVIVDPWNELEHAKAPGESTTDYTGRAIRQIKRFGRQYNVTTLLCAHPTKDFMRTRDGTPRAVTLYDVEGAAHWANKSDIGIVVERNDQIENGSTITVAKLRYRKYGVCGAYEMTFDPLRQRYSCNSGPK